MIHQIKALYNNSGGLPETQIVKQPGISLNTVSMYLKLEESRIPAQAGQPDSLLLRALSRRIMIGI